MLIITLFQPLIYLHKKNFAGRFTQKTTYTFSYQTPHMFCTSGLLWKETSSCYSIGSLQMLTGFNGYSTLCQLATWTCSRMHSDREKPLTFAQLHGGARFIELKVYLPWFDLFPFWMQALNTNTSGLLDDEKEKKTHAHTHIDIHMHGLETLQPSFSCRALNSPRTRQKASGRTKQKEESETGKDREEQVIFCLLCSSSPFFFFFFTCER